MWKTANDAPPHQGPWCCDSLPPISSAEKEEETRKLEILSGDKFDFLLAILNDADMKCFHGPSLE